MGVALPRSIAPAAETSEARAAEIMKESQGLEHLRRGEGALYSVVSRCFHELERIALAEAWETLGC